MNSKVTMCERTFALGRNRYKVNSNDSWQCLLWGWFIDGNRTPEYRWSYIPKDKVPNEVLKQAEL